MANYTQPLTDAEAELLARMAYAEGTGSRLAQIGHLLQARNRVAHVEAGLRKYYADRPDYNLQHKDKNGEVYKITTAKYYRTPGAVPFDPNSTVMRVIADDYQYEVMEGGVHNMNALRGQQLEELKVLAHAVFAGEVPDITGGAVSFLEPGIVQDRSGTRIPSSIGAEASLIVPGAIASTTDDKVTTTIQISQNSKHYFLGGNPELAVKAQAQLMQMAVNPEYAELFNGVDFRHSHEYQNASALAGAGVMPFVGDEMDFTRAGATPELYAPALGAAEVEAGKAAVAEAKDLFAEAKRQAEADARKTTDSAPHADTGITLDDVVNSALGADGADGAKKTNKAHAAHEAMAKAAEAAGVTDEILAEQGVDIEALNKERGVVAPAALDADDKKLGLDNGTLVQGADGTLLDPAKATIGPESEKALGVVQAVLDDPKKQLEIRERQQTPEQKQEWDETKRELQRAAAAAGMGEDELILMLLAAAMAFITGDDEALQMIMDNVFGRAAENNYEPWSGSRRGYDGVNSPQTYIAAQRNGDVRHTVNTGGLKVQSGDIASEADIARISAATGISVDKLRENANSVATVLNGLHPDIKAAVTEGIAKSWQAGKPVMLTPSLLSADRSDQFGFRGNGSFDGVNPKLAHIIEATAMDFPLRVRVMSGKNGRASGVHSQGNAVDITIYDQDGNALGNYQNPENFRVYEAFAQLAYLKTKEMYPELVDGNGEDFNWGGLFGDNGNGGYKYGSLDLMDFRFEDGSKFRAGSIMGGLNKSHNWYDNGDLLGGSQAYSPEALEATLRELENFRLTPQQAAHNKRTLFGVGRASGTLAPRPPGYLNARYLAFDLVPLDAEGNPMTDIDPNTRAELEGIFTGYGFNVNDAAGSGRLSFQVGDSDKYANLAVIPGSEAKVVGGLPQIPDEWRDPSWKTAMPYELDASGRPIIPAAIANGADPLTKNIPQRRADARGGSTVVAGLMSVGGTDRDRVIVEEITKKGNIPDFMRDLKPITVTGKDRAGNLFSITYEVMPDYLAVGSDRDFVRVPMGLPAATAIASKFDMMLPTRTMVDQIYRQAVIKVEPQPMTPGPQMSSTDYLDRHNRTIHGQLKSRVPVVLVAGHKKDLVITNLLEENRGRVAIYGWHQTNGQPIQSLSTVHGTTYADYSHGVRLVSQTAELTAEDGTVVTVRMADLLADPDYASALNGEEGVIGHAVMQANGIKTSGVPIDDQLEDARIAAEQKRKEEQERREKEKQPPAQTLPTLDLYSGFVGGDLLTDSMDPDTITGAAGGDMLFAGADPLEVARNAARIAALGMLSQLSEENLKDLTSENGNGLDVREAAKAALSAGVKGPSAANDNSDGGANDDTPKSEKDVAGELGAKGVTAAEDSTTPPLPAEVASAAKKPLPQNQVI